MQSVSMSVACKPASCFLQLAFRSLLLWFLDEFGSGFLAALGTMVRSSAAIGHGWSSQSIHGIGLPS